MMYNLCSGLRGAMCPVQDTGGLAVDNVKRLAVNLYAELLSRYTFLHAGFLHFYVLVKKAFFTQKDSK